MQVILLENIHHLGNLGDVVKVKDGYGRNFLIPQGHAKRATKAAIAEFETRRADLEKAQAERLANAQALQEKLNGATVTIAYKAGVDGRLFGSVTNSDIAEAVDKLGFTIKKSQVRTPLGMIKAVGEYPITIALLSVPIPWSPSPMALSTSVRYALFSIILSAMYRIRLRTFCSFSVSSIVSPFLSCIIWAVAWSEVGDNFAPFYRMYFMTEMENPPISIQVQ